MARVRVWWTDDFEGHWPVGTAAVVQAADEDQARNMLASALRYRGLKNGLRADSKLHELPEGAPHCVVICDGDY